MPLELIPLFSGSSGNAVLVSGDAGLLLVDAGVSARRLTDALALCGVKREDILALLITHEHADHIAGVKVFAGNGDIPVYATPGTRQAAGQRIIGRRTDLRDVPMSGFFVGGFWVEPFRTSHDAADPVGYAIGCGTDRVAVATDTGRVTKALEYACLGAREILLESNHDLEMLKTGPYPYRLKMRVGSGKGHLNNDACAAEALRLAKGGAERIILGHLSRQNNLPELAYRATAERLKEEGIVPGRDLRLEVAAPAPGGMDAPRRERDG